MTMHVSAPPQDTWRTFAGRALRNRSFVIGFAITLLVAAMAALSFVWTPYDVTRLVVGDRMLPPSATHLFGTDHFGRDVLSRLIWGARVSLMVGLVVVTFALAFGVPIGLAAGYLAGRVDNLLMRLMDAFLTFPPLLLGVAIVGLLGPDIHNVVIALGIAQVPVLARIVRGSTMAVANETYIVATRALGASNARIVVRHVLRNILSPIVVQLTIVFSAAVIAEASLSFLGLGTQPPQPSWGRDLSEARRYMAEAPWLFLAPTFAIMLCVLSINFLGDGLRDALDPRSWRRQAAPTATQGQAS